MCVLKYFYDSVKDNRETNPYFKINMKTYDARKALIALAENVYTIDTAEGQKDFVELGIERVENFTSETSSDANRYKDNTQE